MCQSSTKRMEKGKEQRNEEKRKIMKQGMISSHVLPKTASEDINISQGFKYFRRMDKRDSKREIVDHRLSKNQLVRFPDSCDWTPATGALLSFPPPPPRSGFAIREPPKLKPPLPSILGRPLVEPCFAASSRSLTAVSCASNL